MTLPFEFSIDVYFCDKILRRKLYCEKFIRMFYLTCITISCSKRGGCCMKNRSSTQIVPLNPHISERLWFRASEYGHRDTVFLPRPEWSGVKSIGVESTPLSKPQRYFIQSHGSPTFAHTLFQPHGWKATLVNMHGLVAQSFRQIIIGHADYRVCGHAHNCVWPCMRISVVRR